MRAIIIHLSAILAVGLAIYFPLLDIILAAIYIYVIWREGCYCRLRCGRITMAAVAIIWQLPGYLLAGAILLSVESVAQFSYYFIFMLELWDTPVLPLFSLLPDWTWLDRPLYYYLLFLTAPLLSLLYYSPEFIKKD